MWFLWNKRVKSEMHLLKVKKNVKLKSQLVKFKNLKCVSLLHKSELCFFQLCEIEIDVIFVKQTSAEPNVGSESELKYQLVKLVILNYVMVYFKIVNHVVSKMCN